MNLLSLSETDIRTKFITPAIAQAGWDLHKQIREEEYFTAGKIQVRGSITKRDKGKKADYVLYYKRGLKLAIIEAKDAKHSVGAGMQQALDYAQILDVPFVYSSNGKAFIEHDRTKKEGVVEREIPLDQFPSPEQLWNRYLESKGLAEKKEFIEQPYHFEQGGRPPRYYQEIAINRAIEAIAKGVNRMLLVMATGTGKTLTAFQIIWRYWKTGQNKRILFLADRNILVDDPIRKYFGSVSDVVHKISRRDVSKAHQIYFALYQAVSGNEEFDDVFTEYSKDFFDLIIVDECHRGSAADDSAWRRVLEYFDSAVQIGLTATPKETNTVSNIDYFGEPIYTYSLKQGIEDGFLAPYKVVRFTTDRDAEGWRPVKGFTDKYGIEVPDRLYNEKDFDAELVLEDRNRLVASKITEFLKQTDAYAKTIVFCRDIDHAERMRQQLVNQNAEQVQRNGHYVVRITGDEPSGKALLDHFMDPEETYPVIATTSKLLTTGVDIPNCKLIVLDANIGSMTEFKQIIGRGTRISEDYGKMYFTIMDFRNVTRLFADPDFDGEPVQVKTFGPDDSPIPEEEPGVTTIEDPVEGEADPTTGQETDPYIPGEEGGGESGGERPQKYYVNNVPVKIINQRVLFYGDDGKLITESLTDFTKKNVLQQFRTLDEFLKAWQEADKKQAIVEELKEQGVFFEELEQEVSRELDPFDLICHIAFEQPPLTRQERANNVKKRNYFGKYGEQARKVLEALLDKYAESGLESLEDVRILKVEPFSSWGSQMELVKAFGDSKGYRTAIRELEEELYKVG